jgi:hypothetical protein
MLVSQALTYPRINIGCSARVVQHPSSVVERGTATPLFEVLRYNNKLLRSSLPYLCSDNVQDGGQVHQVTALIILVVDDNNLVGAQGRLTRDVVMAMTNPPVPPSKLVEAPLLSQSHHSSQAWVCNMISSAIALLWLHC